MLFLSEEIFFLCKCIQFLSNHTAFYTQENMTTLSHTTNRPVSTVSMLLAGKWMKYVLNTSKRKRPFSSPQRLGRSNSTPTGCWVLLFPGIRQQQSKANHPTHLVSRLRINDITHPLPHMLSWHEKRLLYDANERNNVCAYIYFTDNFA